MITQDQATRIAVTWLRRSMGKGAVMSGSPQEVAEGWVFNWGYARLFSRKRERLKAPGTGPFIVSKVDGSIFELSNLLPLELAVAEYGDLRSRLEPVEGPSAIEDIMKHESGAAWALIIGDPPDSHSESYKGYFVDSRLVIEEIGSTRPMHDWSRFSRIRMAARRAQPGWALRASELIRENSSAHVTFRKGVPYLVTPTGTTNLNSSE
jgi:hypothetical protein